MPVETIDVTSQHLSMSTPITSENVDFWKLQELKRYGTQILLDMTSGIRSQVKGHGIYGLDIVREDVKLINC